MTHHHFLLSVTAALQFLLLHPAGIYGQDMGKNYILTRTYTGSRETQHIDQIAYYDGFGRRVQTVRKGVTPSGKNLADLEEYDQLGRKSKAWLPVPTSSETVEANTFPDVSTTCYGGDGHAFAQTFYEPLATGRPVENSGPGDAWESHRAKMQYLVNEDIGILACNDYRVDEATGNLICSGPYAAKELSVVNGTDEDGHVSYVFKDRLDRTLLKRELCDGRPHDTYYVYDNLNHLRYVLPPMYATDPDIDRYGYQYRYDSRGRCVWKQLPGCAPVIYKYDSGDRMTVMQDGLLRSRGLYRFYLYDTLGRQVVQGTCRSCPDGLFPAVSLDTSSPGVCGTGYVFQRISSVGNASLELADYYDSYDFLHLPVIKAKKSFSYMSGRTYPRVNGMKTCEMTGTTCDSIIASVFNYDTRYLLSDICRSEMDGVSSSVGYDYSYTGKLTGSYCDYPGSGNSTGLYTNLSYNPRNDMLEQITWDTGAHTKDHQINYTYDELLRKKAETHPGNGNVISYVYNLRGWLTSISSPYFNEIIHYVDGPGTPCYNGNISAMQWQASSSLWRGYKFRYDDLNRLKDAVYGEGQDITDNAGRYDEHVPSYTQSGSIARLQRSGRLNDGTYGLVDDLSMTYAGNRLTGVSYRAPSVNYENAFDFKKPERFVLGAEYTYNDNGALLSDYNKGIKSIEYSNTGMPTRIEFTNGNLTEYVYSYSGEKLKTIHSTVFTIVEPELLGNGVVIRKQTETKYKSPIDSTLYVSPGLEKTGDRLRFLFDGGYLDYTEIPQQLPILNYGFYVKDHLGNVRSVVTDDGGCVQSTQYYPFGGIMGDLSTGPDVQHHKYNGKEYDHIHGLDWYDYGARSYDPALATWTSVDPLAEKYPSISPYAYCGDNPVNAYDSDGRSTWVINQRNGKYKVVGGNLNDKDKNIYVGYFNKKGEFVRGNSIGITPSLTSFYNSDAKGGGSWRKGSIIDIKDKSGDKFLEKIISDNPPMIDDYMMNARNNKSYDFKVTNGTNRKIPGIDIYRGMPIGVNGKGQTIYTSARDVGNIAAGYVAGVNGMTWEAARVAFDSYQGGMEGSSTINAERNGWLMGYNNADFNKKMDNLLRSLGSSIISIWNYFTR